MRSRHVPFSRLSSQATSDDTIFVERSVRRLARPDDSFDRLEFAREVLRRLAPERVRVTLYEGRFELAVKRGRLWGADEEVHWAMVSIPPDACREQIAVTLAQIAGVSEVPYVVATLLAPPAARSAGALPQ